MCDLHYVDGIIAASEQVSNRERGALEVAAYSRLRRLPYHDRATMPGLIAFGCGFVLCGWDYRP